MIRRPFRISTNNSLLLDLSLSGDFTSNLNVVSHAMDPPVVLSIVPIHLTGLLSLESNVFLPLPAPLSLYSLAHSLTLPLFPSPPLHHTLPLCISLTPPPPPLPLSFPPSQAHAGKKKRSADSRSTGTPDSLSDIPPM